MPSASTARPASWTNTESSLCGRTMPTCDRLATSRAMAVVASKCRRREAVSPCRNCPTASLAPARCAWELHGADPLLGTSIGVVAVAQLLQGGGLALSLRVDLRTRARQMLLNA